MNLTAERDCLLEESGFEPLVPPALNPTNAGERDEEKAVELVQIEARMSPRSEWLAQDSPLEGSGFELPVPREISSGFEASAELRPIDPRRGGIIRAVIGLGK